MRDRNSRKTIEKQNNSLLFCGHYKKGDVITQMNFYILDELNTIKKEFFTGLSVSYVGWQYIMEVHITKIQPFKSFLFVL